MQDQTVVITGASGGIGRATARLFGERGARVVLIARGQAGLDGAAADVAKAGGKPLAIAADVADYQQVAAAARQAEEHFGPIDVWVNDAFTSVFAPFNEITAAEFRRVTEVSYLGYVHGTMAALQRMRPRDHGTIVQVGSALGAAQHPAPVGLLRRQARGQRVHLVAALRTDARGLRGPASPWCRCPRSTPRSSPGSGPGCRGTRSRCRRSTSPRWPPAPCCSPPTTPAASSTGWVPARPPPCWPRSSPPRCWTGTWPGPGTTSQQTGEHAAPGRPDNLREPADGPGGRDYGPHGVFGDKSHPRSAQEWLSQHARLTTAGALAGVTAGALAGGWRAVASRRDR